MILPNENEILAVGLLLPENDSGKLHQWCYIYSSGGVSPSLCARDFKTPIRIVVSDGEF